MVIVIVVVVVVVVAAVVVVVVFVSEGSPAPALTRAWAMTMLPAAQAVCRAVWPRRLGCSSKPDALGIDFAVACGCFNHPHDRGVDRNRKPQ